MAPIARLGSVYEQPEYLAASAAHAGATFEIVTAAGASLPILRYPDGSRRTVYGLPRPYGEPGREALAGLADVLAFDRAGLEAILSPFHPGPELAELLCERSGQLHGQRQICVTELRDVDPAVEFRSDARRKIRVSSRRGVGVEIGPLPSWFGAFYREAMGGIRADSLYLFSDEYFAALTPLDHFVVSVLDAHGVAAAALFVGVQPEMYYHLSGRRPAPRPVYGAMSGVVGEGIREAWRKGYQLVVLGGGLSDRADDPLLSFKRELATSTLSRSWVSVR